MKDGFLAQSSFDENDMYCTPERQVAILRIILALYRRGRDLIQTGIPLARIRSLECVPHILRAKTTYGNNDLERLQELEQKVTEETDTLAKEYLKEATFDVDMHATMI
jgi:V/A-type H+-transporting ATPase subunit A